MNAIQNAINAVTKDACRCDCETIQPGCYLQVAEEVAAFLNASPPDAQTIRRYLGSVPAESMFYIYAYHRWLTAMVTGKVK